jgi:hypothetical protein
MSVRGVKNRIQQLTTDGTLDANEAKQVIAEAGGSVSRGEQEAIAGTLAFNSGFEVTADARQLLAETVGDLQNIRAFTTRRNEAVERRGELLGVQEKARMEPGVVTETLGGSQIPEAVKEIVNKAVENGAVAYDVAEVEDRPVEDDKGDGFTVAGKWSPYPQEIQAVGNMSFEYTEITPQSLQEDMNTETETRVLTGYRNESYTDPRTGASRDVRIAEYETRRLKGNGNISAHYDEASHGDTYARLPSGQKYASNFAILSDGSLHALPVMRRNHAQPGLILTNPSLARGQRMLFNGHIGMREGVITSIGMSGRLHKLAANGDAKFINPLPLLEAWGFEIAPNVRLQFEGRHDTPPVDPDTHVVG